LGCRDQAPAVLCIAGGPTPLNRYRESFVRNIALRSEERPPEWGQFHVAGRRESERARMRCRSVAANRRSPARLVYTASERLEREPWTLSATPRSSLSLPEQMVSSACDSRIREKQVRPRTQRATQNGKKGKSVAGEKLLPPGAVPPPELVGRAVIIRRILPTDCANWCYEH
jgi:hypothetical protein